MPYTAAPADKTVTTLTRNWFSGKLLTVCAALGVSLAAAELVEVNRFLRSVVQGRAFWYYVLVLLVVLGLLLGATVKRGAASQAESLIKLLPVGIVFGFLAGLIAISATPLLVHGSLSPSISAWRHPLYLGYAVFLGLGWFYGALAELAIFFIQRGRYRHIALLMLACAAIRLVEMLPLARLIHR